MRKGDEWKQRGRWDYRKICTQMATTKRRQDTDAVGEVATKSTSGKSKLGHTHPNIRSTKPNISSAVQKFKVKLPP